MSEPQPTQQTPRQRLMLELAAVGCAALSAVTILIVFWARQLEYKGGAPANFRWVAHWGWAFCGGWFFGATTVIIIVRMAARYRMNCLQRPLLWLSLILLAPFGFEVCFMVDGLLQALILEYVRNK